MTLTGNYCVKKSEDFECCFWYFANALVKLNLFNLMTRKHLGDSVQIKEGKSGYICY